MSPLWLRRMSSAGLWLGAASWAISLQTNYALAPVLCQGRAVVVTAIAAVLMLVSLAGGAMSLRAARMPASVEWHDSPGGLPRQFVAWVGVGSGVLFALAILNQLIASLIVGGCLR
jgi:hypothetical protein